MAGAAQHPTLAADAYDLPTRASSSSHERGQGTMSAAYLSVDCVEQPAIQFTVYRLLAGHFQEQIAD